MAQTTKDPNNSESKSGRPGQRQKERQMRLARRRHRQRIVISTIVLIVLIAVVWLSFWQYQKYNADQLALRDVHATATVNVSNNRAIATEKAKGQEATATAYVLGRQAVATVQSCLLPQPSAGPASPPSISQKPVTLPDGLQYIDIHPGCGATVQNGRTASAQYTGWLQSNGQKFDSSYDRHGTPFPVPVGQGKVLKGWDEGLIGMKAGGSRRLIIPPVLGYGSQGPQGIPPNATLIFDITVLSVQ